MMTLTNSSRKRECSEDSEYLPVTKRMNNLHIDVISNEINESLIGRQVNGLELNSSEQTLHNSVLQNQRPNHLVNAMNSLNCVQNSFDCPTIYSPELDLNSNPIYYESNKILFEAHKHRVQRIGTNTRHEFNRKS